MNANNSKALWTSRILFGLVTLFLAWDAGMKVFATHIAVDGDRSRRLPSRNRTTHRIHPGALPDRAADALEHGAERDYR